MPSDYTPKQFLEDPLVDRGNSLQALAKRHARLYIHMNIWQRPPEWIGVLLEDGTLGQGYAFALYCRLVLRYGITCPLPEDGQVIDPMWWEISPIAAAGVKETEHQALARMLYIATFTQELGCYAWSYIAEHAGRWNSRIHELAQGSLRLEDAPEIRVLSTHKPT